MASLDWSVYLVLCGDGSLYTGIAVDVAARLEKHRAGRGAKYLRGRGPLEVVFHESVGDRSLALRLEGAIKRLPAERKRDLIEGRSELATLRARLDP